MFDENISNFHFFKGIPLLIIYLKASVARLRFRLRSTQLFFLKKFTRCANFFCAKRNLRLSRSLQSHFARCRAKKSHYPSRIMSHSVMAITEAVVLYLEPRLYTTAVNKYTLSYLFTWGFSPLISPINPF
jgi:hypothetical protein